jgi:hypothetical protein
MTEELRAPRHPASHADQLEMQWNWLGAADVYDEALTRTPDGDHRRIGDLLERKAYALHRAGLQVDTVTEFEELTRKAIQGYAGAKEAHGSASGPEARGRSHRCDAMTSYLEYWLAHDSAEKKNKVRDAWNQAKSAMSIFETSGRPRDFAETFGHLSYAAAISYDYDGEAESRENTLREALSCAEKSIRYLTELKDSENLARAHAKAAGLLVAIEVDFASFSDKDKVDLEAWNHWLKAKEASEEAALSETPFFVILQSWPAACTIEERAETYLKAKEVAERSHDRFILGCVLDGLAQRKFLMAMAADDPQEVESLSKEGFEIAKASRENLAVVRFTSPNVICVWIHVPEAGYYYSRSEEERDTNLRRDLLYKAHHPCIEQLSLAKESGYPDVRSAAHFMLGSTFKELGKIEPGIDMKKSYLEHAVENLNVAIVEDRRIHPTEYLPQGLDLLNLAEAQSEIAHMTTNATKKSSILREAVNRKREALALCEKELDATQDSNPEIGSEIAEGYRSAGNWTKELCAISGDNSCLLLAAECLDRAVVWYTRAGLSSLSAEVNWEAAQTHDKMGEFMKASERFDRAAEDYRRAAQSVPRLGEFYADHAIYMRAWGEIERGRHHHARQEPGLAKECYENASAMHKSSRRWSHLTTNYSAWAKVEQAEDLSSREKYQEAVNAFEEAAHLFREAKKNLHDQLTKIEDSAEQQSTRDLERAAETRSRYCEARIVLERARELDKQGDASGSANKYGQAAALFDVILENLEFEQDRKEFRLAATLSKAWKAMATAEAEASPEKYEEASRLFEEARGLTTGEKPKLLMSGHSRFCRALGVGAKFVDTRDIALHAEATKHLESAADSYLKADHKEDSDYAKASKLLFDGYVQMGRASKEEDQVKKTKLYAMAEKVLQTSASIYDRVREPSRRDQVLRLLEKVKEERELALSLTELLHAPDAASATAAFPSPTPSQESATGLGRFEHADIQVTLIINPKNPIVGQDVEIVFEMTNAGKGTAILKRVEDILPGGFEVAAKPDTCAIENHSLVMKVKRLDALHSEVVRLVLKPTSKGRFVLRPRIRYVDESGTEKDQAPEPVEITVIELGISGWLKGPGKRS